MLLVKQLFAARGLETPHDRIKLIRHSAHDGRELRRIIADGYFEMYQAEQDAKVKPFHKCDVILSFIGIEGNQAEFFGAYEVSGFREFKRSDFRGAPDYLTNALQLKKERIWHDLRGREP